MSGTDAAIAGNNLKLKFDKIYVKEISCKIPYAPQVFESADFKEFMSQPLSPTMEINVKTQKVKTNKHEVTVHLIINCKFKNFSILTLEIQQAGIFIIEDSTNAELEYILKNVCPSLLHPYLSQVVTNQLIQAGFPPIVLQPLQPIINKKVIENQ